jgi:hypothetical protein
MPAHSVEDLPGKRTEGRDRQLRLAGLGPAGVGARDSSRAAERLSVSR